MEKEIEIILAKNNRQNRIYRILNYIKSTENIVDKEMHEEISLHLIETLCDTPLEAFKGDYDSINTGFKAKK